MDATVPLLLTAGWTAGVNAYATVVLFCVAGRADLLEVPSLFERTDVLVVAGIMFCVEFVTDKVPLLDSAWDVVHTVIRPLVGGATGALIAGEDGARELLQVAAGGGSGGMALASHAVKASVRAAINTSPEPLSNIATSLAEDLVVAGVVLLATEEPWVAFGIVVVLLVAGLALVRMLAARVRRGMARLRRPRVE